MDDGDILIALFDGPANENNPVYAEWKAELDAYYAAEAARDKTPPDPYFSGDVLSIVKTHNYLAQNKGK